MYKRTLKQFSKRLGDIERSVAEIKSKCHAATAETVVNSIGMELAVLPGGEFLMGSTAEEVATIIFKETHDIIARARTRPDVWNLWGWIPFIRSEYPQHCVKLSKPFAMGVYPVTVGQFRSFVEATCYHTEGETNSQGSFGLDLNTGLVELKSTYTWQSGDNPGDPPKWLVENSANPSGFTQTDSSPVTCVTWNDAQKFCEWLSDKEGAKYRLPTEAEWEYACRAGSRTRYYFGDCEAGLQKAGNVADRSLQEQWSIRLPPFILPQQPPYAESWLDGFPFTSPVGSFSKYKEGRNAFGLCDLIGNVGEWCSDWFDETYYSVSPSVDPKGPEAPPAFPPSGVNWPRRNPLDLGSELAVTPQPLRVVRGGVWLDPEFGFRSADRGTHLRHPVLSAADIGFRVVREESEIITGASVRMPGEGHVLDPPHGDFRGKIDAQGSGGKCFVFEATLSGNHPGVPIHLHEKELELLFVAKGEFILAVGDPRYPEDRSRDRTYRAPEGTVACFPPMTPHGVRNAHTASDDKAVALIIVLPAGLEQLYEEAKGLPPEAFIKLGKEKYGMVTLGPPPLPEQ